jgi:hypothetical protein
MSAVGPEPDKEAPDGRCGTAQPGREQPPHGVLLLDGSRAEAKVDRAAANSWKPSVANVMTRTRGRLALCP